jgi:ribosomal protein S18 acetylase RimI-like enzyme
MVDAKNMVLDVESDNAGAVRLYENMGYEVVKEHSIKIGNSRSLHFKRMVKSVI